MTTMKLVAETYEDVAEKALDDLRDEVGSRKIEHKKIAVQTE